MSLEDISSLQNTFHPPLSSSLPAFISRPQGDSFSDMQIVFTVSYYQPIIAAMLFGLHVNFTVLRVYFVTLTVCHFLFTVCLTEHN